MNESHFNLILGPKSLIFFFESRLVCLFDSESVSAEKKYLSTKVKFLTSLTNIILTSLKTYPQVKCEAGTIFGNSGDFEIYNVKSWTLP